MGKSKQITLNQEELRKICQNAVEDGVAKYINLEEQKKKSGMERVAIPNKEATGELHKAERLCRSGDSNAGTSGAGR